MATFGLLFLLALAIRLPYFHLVPRFEDEGLEVIRALEVARGTNVPLIGYDIYYGPLFTLIVAAFFRVVDVDLLTARAVAVVCGALTVPATYLLGCVVGGKRVALVAALLALTSPILVVVGSHFGWSNSLVPFLATTMLTAVYLGVTQRRWTWLALGGFLAGLTMQAHPLSVVLIAALVAWYFVYCPPAEWFKRPEVYAAAVSFAVGYAPMLWILAGRLDQVIASAQKQSYVFGPVESGGQYFERVLAAFGMLGITIAGVGERLWAAFPEAPQTRQAVLLLVVLVAGCGLVLSASRRPLASSSTVRSRSFLAVVLLLPVLLLPLFTRSLQSRYLMMLVPVACVCIGLACARVWEGAASARRLAAVGIVIAILTANLVAIVRVERRALQEGESNAAWLSLRDAVDQHSLCQDGVFIEDTDALGLPPGDSRTWTYFNTQAVRFVLTLENCVQTVAPVGRLLDMLKARPSPAWLIIPEQSVAVFSQDLTLTRVLPLAPAPTLPAALRLTLFRAEPRP